MHLAKLFIVILCATSSFGWWCRGERGERGYRGHRGHTGAKGDKGENGFGYNGAKGDKGDRGDTGYGYPGVNGERGPIGLTGSKGDKGNRGDTGPVGPPGIKGEQGACECTKEVVSSLMKSMLEMRGPPGDKGTPGSDGVPELNGTCVSSARTADQEAMNSLDSGTNQPIYNRTELISQIEHLTERLINAEKNITTLNHNIEYLKNATLLEPQY